MAPQTLSTLPNRNDTIMMKCKNLPTEGDTGYSYAGYDRINEKILFDKLCGGMLTAEEYHRRIQSRYVKDTIRSRIINKRQLEIQRCNAQLYAKYYHVPLININSNNIQSHPYACASFPVTNTNTDNGRKRKQEIQNGRWKKQMTSSILTDHSIDHLLSKNTTSDQRQQLTVENTKRFRQSDRQLFVHPSQPTVEFVYIPEDARDDSSDYDEDLLDDLLDAVNL